MRVSSKAILAALAITAVIAGFGLADKNASATSGCPIGFVPVPAVDSPSVDRNEDGIICRKRTRGAGVKYVDNNAATDG